MTCTLFPDGAVALVTGASRGIGLAAAERFAKAGVRTVLAARTGSSCQAEAERLTADYGVECTGLSCDVRVPGDVVTTLRAVHKQYGRLDILVNNAGILADARLGMIAQSDIDATFQTNILGAIQMLQTASRLLARSPAGAVVNVTSVVGLDGNIGQAVYSASKAAIVGFTRSAARELAPAIRVNAVAPGLIDTAMTASLPVQARRELEARIPLGRPGAAEDVAAVIAFLASQDARYVTGQVVRVDGGMLV
jgi:3-oxoacyl-[acyl-carrier protein] reductase